MRVLRLFGSLRVLVGRAGFEWSYILSDYGEDWRVCRKMTHREFNATAFKKYRPILAHQAQELVRRLAREPVAHLAVYLKQ